MACLAILLLLTSAAVAVGEGPALAGSSYAAAAVAARRAAVSTDAAQDEPSACLLQVDKARVAERRGPTAAAPASLAEQPAEPAAAREATSAEGTADKAARSGDGAPMPALLDGPRLVDSALELVGAAFGSHSEALVQRAVGDQGTLAFLLPALCLLPTLSMLLWLSARSLRHATDDSTRLKAEFVGTAVLVFTASCCVNNSAGPWNPTAVACVLMAMVYALGPVSGAHLNPAVTLALALSGDHPWTEVWKYWAAQLAGSLVAATTSSWLFARALVLAPAAPFLGCHAMLAELLYTFMLAFVFLNCVASKKNNSPNDGNQFFGLAIGFVLIAGGHAVGPVSGAALNPAVALALDIKHFGFGWGAWYALFEFIGACGAALLYELVRPEEQQPLFSSDLLEYESSLGARCISEFVGAFMLTLTVCLNLASGSASTAWSAAAAYMSMIYSLGNVSGGHFNPAVTFAFVALDHGKTTPRQGASYAASQVLGGMCAALVSSLFLAGSDNRGLPFGIHPLGGHSFATAGFVELFYTAVLAFVVLSLTATRAPTSQVTRQKFYDALAIGASVAAGGVAAGGVSGAALNPAVAAGVAMMGRMGSAAVPPSLVYLGAFMLLQLAGGAVASAVFRVTTKSQDEDAPSGMLARLGCEFVGTFVLVFTVGCCLLKGSSTWNATAIGFVYMAMVYATGPVSGGCLNPAVSVALGLMGSIKPGEVARYCAAQLAAGAAAGLVILAIFAPASPQVGPVAPFSWFHSCLLEAVFTFMLCFTVLNCAVSKRNNPELDGNQFYGLAIGMVIVAGGHAAGGISGAAFNPAVSLGLDVKHLGFQWGIVWSLFQIFGATVAAAAYFAVRPDERLATEAFRSYQPTLRTRCCAEFIGVFLLVLTMGLNLAAGTGAGAWSAAAAVMCLCYSLWNVSGAHFNPAITLAMCTSGRQLCSPREGCLYTAVQLVAGLTAGLFAAMFRTASVDSNKSFAPGAGSGFNLAAAGFVEMVFTAVLAFVALAVTKTKASETWRTKQNFYFALAVGGVVVAGCFAVGGISGGLFNPAVALGAAAESFSVGSLITYILWQSCGALLASLAFRSTFPEEFKTILDEPSLGNAGSSY